jgi:hypothetical protein
MIVRTLGGTFSVGRSGRGGGSSCTRVVSDGCGGYTKHSSEVRQTSQKQQAGNTWAEENERAVGNKKD